MSLLCINCRGLGESSVVDDLCALVQRLSRSLVFLSETKRSKAEMHGIIARRFRDFFGVAVDARGRAGGIALLWLKSVNVTLMSYSLNHSYVTVCWGWMIPCGVLRVFMGGRRVKIKGE